MENCGGSRFRGGRVELIQPLIKSLQALVQRLLLLLVRIGEGVVDLLGLRFLCGTDTVAIRSLARRVDSLTATSAPSTQLEVRKRSEKTLSQHERLPLVVDLEDRIQGRCIGGGVLLI